MASILAISAHPDDETLFTGGTLAMYAQKGHKVFILETTRGQGGEVGEPPLTTRENLASFREQEVRQNLWSFSVFFFSADDLQDKSVTDYKKKIKLLLFALLGLFALYILIAMVT